MDQQGKTVTLKSLLATLNAAERSLNRESESYQEVIESAHSDLVHAMDEYEEKCQEVHEFLSLARQEAEAEAEQAQQASGLTESEWKKGSEGKRYVEWIENLTAAEDKYNIDNLSLEEPETPDFDLPDTSDWEDIQLELPEPGCAQCNKQLKSEKFALLIPSQKDANFCSRECALTRATQLLGTLIVKA